MARHRLNRRVAAAVALAALLGLVGAACADPPDVLDKRRSEADIVTELARRLPVAPESVTCRGAPRRSTGSVQRCTARLTDGRDIEMEVTSTADDRLEVDLSDIVLERERIERRIRDTLEAEHERSFGVDCDEPAIIVVEAGDTIGCEIRDEDHRRNVRVEILDADGRLEIRLG